LDGPEARHHAISLLQARAYRDVFQKAGEDWFAAFGRGGYDHAVRFQAAEFAGREVGHDYDLAADECFGLVGLRDSGHQLADFGSEIDFDAQ
jgi:hypothetical protein